MITTEIDICIVRKNMASYYYRQFFWKLLELGAIPDWVLRSRIKKSLQELLTELSANGEVESQGEIMRTFLAEIRTMAIAVSQSNANEQHYEVPAEFYHLVLGPNLKYSSGLWPQGDETSLEESEVEMLNVYCKRAQLKNGKGTLVNNLMDWDTICVFLPNFCRFLFHFKIYTAM